MSNMIRTSAILIGAAALALAGCKPAERPPEVATQTEKAPPPPIVPLSSPVPAQIDPEPADTRASRILAREDIVVAGQPACALTVRYAGQIDQPVTWRGERCADLDIRFVSTSEIARIGQGAKLSSETRDDIDALPGGRTLYIEGKAASAIYPANAEDRINKVPLAD